MNLNNKLPIEVRKLIREAKYTEQTSGLCDGYAQANLVILPKKYAYDFLLFTQRNPKACPVLEVGDVGDPYLKKIAKDCNITTDIPKYRIYENGILKGEYTDVSAFWRDDLVSFLIGCSFSFESELMENGVPIKHIEQHCNVPMYNTNIKCEQAGAFNGNMVVSMRPLRPKDIIKAIQITSSMPRVHGAPVHIGKPEDIGIININKPDYGDAVSINSDEIPVFWACGVTPQAVVMNSKHDFCITHAPGHMLITDIKNSSLKF